MIINSTYTVYKRGTKTTRESRACLPVTGTFTFFNSFFFFFSFFFAEWHIHSLDMYKDHPIKYQLKRYLTWNQFCPFSSPPTRFVFFFFSKQVYVVKRHPTASLHTCIKTEISTVFTETSSFKEKLINTDCVVSSGAKVTQKASDHRRSKQEGILQLKYGDIIAVKLLSRPIKLNITLTVSILNGQRQKESKNMQKHVDGLS